MKKILFAACCAALFCIYSCNSGSDNSMQQKNQAASDSISNAFMTGNANGIDNFIADDFVDHTDMGDKKGKDSLKAMINFIHNNMKDMKMEKVHDVADNDYVYSWMKYSGTSDGTMGMPKGPYTMNAMEVSKFKDGKAVEHWGFMDMRDMKMFMPPPPTPQPGNKMDTSKMK
jgi:predicted SnoaL-like aldol condensation-catalyzing enzyme